LNGSSLDDRGGRAYRGGSALRSARRMVVRCRPVRRASSRIPTFSMKCRRRRSAHCSTFSTPFPPGRRCVPPRPSGTAVVRIHREVGHLWTAVRAGSIRATATVERGDHRACSPRELRHLRHRSILSERCHVATARVPIRQAFVLDRAKGR